MYEAHFGLHSRPFGSKAEGPAVFTGPQQAQTIRGLHQGLVAQDAVEVLERRVADDSLDEVLLYFPDPWPKKRHHKRRLIQPAVAHLIANRIRPGGYLHCATDWPHYAEQMLAVLAAEPLLENRFSGFSPRPDWRPLTKFEARGLRLGNPVADLIFMRRPTRAGPSATEQ